MDKALLGELEDVSPPAALEQRWTTLLLAARSAGQALLEAAEAASLTWKKQAYAAVESMAAGTVKDSAFFKKPEAADLFTKHQTVPAAVAASFTRCAAAAGTWLEEAPLLQLGLRYAPAVELARTLAEAFRSNQAEEGHLPGLLIPHLAADLLRAEHGVPDAPRRLGARSPFFGGRISGHQRRAVARPAPLGAGGALARRFADLGGRRKAVHLRLARGRPGPVRRRAWRCVPDRPGPRGERVTLPHNWRSRREVVQHNNLLFTPLENRETALRVLTALLPGTAPTEGLPQAAAKLAPGFCGRGAAKPAPGQARRAGASGRAGGRKR